MEILRTELLESQKNRTDLHRWKMIVVSALAAAALGFTSSPTVPNSELILSVIPLVCAYVDLLYYHDGIVINILGSFLRHHADSEADPAKLIKLYEQFAGKMREVGLGSIKPYHKSMPLRKRFSLFVSDVSDSPSAYQLEKIATFWSSIVVSGLVLAYPFVTPLYLLVCTSCQRAANSPLSVNTVVIGLSGFAGLILTMVINRRYRRIREVVREYAKTGMLQQQVSS